MKKFLLGVLAGLLFAGVVAFVAFVVFARIGSQEKTVEKDSTLVLRLEGPLAEKHGTDMPLPFLGGGAPPTVVELWRTFKKAAADPKIKALVLMPRGMAVGWAKLQELHAGITEFKKSGKPVYVYLRAPRTPEYYLATAADRIFMVPEDVLDMKGLRAEITYFKGTLDKLGVKFEAEHAGKYKDALDSYTRTSMTPETREVMNSVLDVLYDHLAQTVAGGRKMKPDDVKKLLDQGPFLADQALTTGLVDALKFEDEFFDEVKTKIGMEVKRVGFGEYARTTVAGVEGRDRIAIIGGEGAIVRGATSPDPFSEDGMITTAQLSKVMQQVGKDASIKGVILRVDSPGGDAVASDELLREARLLSKKKPMVISMSDVAASGGYYISMTGDPVVAYPNTITGSIGVIYGKANLKGLYDKVGLTKDTVRRGRNAAIDSEYYSLDEEGKRKLREGVDSIYKTFVGLVAESRKKKFEEIHAVAQGRVWMGTQAKEQALVDHLGGIDKAIELVKERAKISKDAKIRLVAFPGKKTLVEQLLSQTAERNVTAEVAMQRGIDRQIREWTGGLPLELFRNGAMLRLMPYRLEFR
ncbi:MAG: signal peptide peptidase SppA [Acidobacteria bacterium]|nr:signal peptide peptidase SppA [Acidobacteriota bacterium]